MRFFLALGSNLGDRRATLATALDELEARGMRVQKRSSLYETDPVGGPPGQPPYLNQVVEIETDLHARALLDAAHAVEASLGRDRTGEGRWGPRTIDVDILFGDEESSEADLIVPHPRMRERAFVLVPLAEIAPDALVAGVPVRQLADAAGSGVRRVD